MGLDMAIYRRKTVYRKDDGTFSENIEDRAWDCFGRSNATVIESVVAYWRNAYAIHSWLVENVQRGKDDREKHDIPFRMVLQLHNDCSNVVHSLNGELIEVRQWDEEDFLEYVEEHPEDNIKQRVKVNSKDVSNLEFNEFMSLSERQKSKVREEMRDFTNDRTLFGTDIIDLDLYADMVKSVKMLDDVVKNDCGKSEFFYRAS